MLGALNTFFFTLIAVIMRHIKPEVNERAVSAHQWFMQASLLNSSLGENYNRLLCYGKESRWSIEHKGIFIQCNVKYL